MASSESDFNGCLWAEDCSSSSLSSDDPDSEPYTPRPRVKNMIIGIYN